MRKTILFTFILYGFHSAFAATHSLRYVYTATSGIPEFPEFVSVGLVDGEQIDYYDSKIRRAEPRQQWMEKSVDASYWNRNTQIYIGEEQVFRSNIEVAKKRFNQTGGVHTAQVMYGCEWDDETGTTSGFNQQGYDGEDFIVLDLKTMTWTAPVPQAFATKQKWDNDRDFCDGLKNYLDQECIDWLKKYLSYGRETQERKVPPKVSLLRKDPSSPVSCHATGFFPRGIMVTWKKNGEDMHEDVETSETLTNGDGTFQTSARLTVKPEDMKTNNYTCVVQHKSSTKDIVIELNENVKTNRAPVPDKPLALIISCVAAAVLVAIAAVVGFIVWKKSKEGYGKASNRDTDSENSDPQTQKL